MLDFAREAVDLARDRTMDDLLTDRLFSLAVPRLIEMIGEAAAYVPPELRGRYPAIPWRDIIGMRNRIIHGYDVITPEKLWDTLVNDLPGLVPELEKMIASEEVRPPASSEDDDE
jgi:uncharacterized protein with HEPN domain